MCGFAGIINSDRPITQEQLAAVAAKVSFRGPDSYGARVMDSQCKPVQQGTTALFFNRLAIMDLDHRSDQPFEDDRYLLMFNGEIYNFPELKSSLQKEGIQFHTTSDTEVLFFALRQWGKAALPKLNGMFALLWLDKQLGNFLVSRDRLGIKPLYYKQDKQSFSFGSELDSILRFSSNAPQVSAKAVEMYLWMQFVPTPYTIIEDIYKLAPGNYIEGSIQQLQKGALLRPEPYWDAYHFTSQQKTPGNKDIETVLEESLGRQLRADVPLGLFLSSGVDSSLLASLIHKYFAKEKDFNFFTVAFTEKTFSDESADAKAFMNGFNNPRLHSHILEVDPKYMQDHVEDLYSYYDEPFGDPASLLNWIISKKAREYVTVAISGDGSDELFWGYPRYNRWQQFGKWNRIPLLPGLMRGTAKLLPSSSLKYNALFVSEPSPVQRHFDQFLPSGMRFKIADSILKYNMWSTEGVETISKREDLPGILDIKTYLSDAMLYKVDRSSMACSLEVRVPYLDNEVLEYALALPFADKSNNRFQNKAPLKQLLLQLAPHYDVNKPKKGFSFPLRKWLKENWKDQVLSSMDANAMLSAGLEPAKYIGLVNDFYKKDTSYHTDVWYIFNLMLWMKSFKKIQPVWMQ